MIYRLNVEVTTPLNPTEVRDRVEAAITNLFPDAEVEERHGELAATTHSLDRFAERLREQAIVDTAREVFFQNRSVSGFSFSLKKQAAHQGKVNFSVGNPDELGDIHVQVAVSGDATADDVIDHVAPRTDTD